MKIRLVVLGALLIPGAAFAQPGPTAPSAPAPPPAPPDPPLTVNPAPPPVPTSHAGTQPEYQEVTESYNGQMLKSGALVFAASYAASVIVAASSSNDRGNDRLYVPVAGPWLALNERSSCDITKSSCDHETTAKVLLVADGVFQAAGILGMIDGVLQPSTHRVVTRTAKLDTKVRLKPILIHGDPGISVYGHF